MQKVIIYLVLANGFEVFISVVEGPDLLVMNTVINAHIQLLPIDNYLLAEVRWWEKLYWLLRRCSWAAGLGPCVHNKVSDTTSVTNISSYIFNTRTEEPLDDLYPRSNLYHTETVNGASSKSCIVQGHDINKICTFHGWVMLHIRQQFNMIHNVSWACHDKFVPNMDPCNLFLRLKSMKNMFSTFLLKYSLQHCYKLLGREM